MMSNNFVRVVLFCIASVTFSGAALSLSVPDWPLKEKFLRSSLVVIGTAINDGYETKRDSTKITTVDFFIETTLKGNKEGKFILITSNESREHIVRCCKAGGRYLMFLEEVAGGYYMSVNGNHGVFEIEESKNGAE